MMKKVILCLTIVSTMFSGTIFAQDIHAIFNNKLTRDVSLSSNTKAIDSWMAVYGELQTNIYSYKGSFEDAVSNMKAPGNADVSDVSNQPLGNNFSMYIMMTENLDPMPMSATWYEKARTKATELAGKTGKSLTLTIGSDQMQNPDNMRVGAKITIRMITLSNPYIDLDNLKVVEGTWVTEIIATTVITQEMLDSDSEYEDEYEDEWDNQEMDMDVDLPAGALFISYNDVADAEILQGDVNYLVEMSTDQVIDFFKNNKKRFVNNFEQSELGAQNGAMISYFYMLKHQGDLKVGDDVVSMTIQPAPKSLLSDALGRNQGTWTLISINRWTEEDY